MASTNGVTPTAVIGRMRKRPPCPVVTEVYTHDCMHMHTGIHHHQSIWVSRESPARGGGGGHLRETLCGKDARAASAAWARHTKLPASSRDGLIKRRWGGSFHRASIAVGDALPLGTRFVVLRGIGAR